MMTIDGRYILYGIFDGHGQHGQIISQWVMNSVLEMVQDGLRTGSSSPLVLLRDIFGKLQSRIASAEIRLDVLSGTTATVVLQDLAQQTISVAHVGNSVATLGQLDALRILKARKLTIEHDPDSPLEKARIEQAGGQVLFDGYAHHRVYTKAGKSLGINTSRSLGDLLCHSIAGGSWEPDLSEHHTTAEDSVLILGTQGVWDALSPQEVVDIVSQFTEEEATEAAEAVTQEAWSRWKVEEAGLDDITAVVIFLRARPFDLPFHCAC